MNPKFSFIALTFLTLSFASFAADPPGPFPPTAPSDAQDKRLAELCEGLAGASQRAASAAALEKEFAPYAKNLITLALDEDMANRASAAEALARDAKRLHGCAGLFARVLSRDLEKYATALNAFKVQVGPVDDPIRRQFAAIGQLGPWFKNLGTELAVAARIAPDDERIASQVIRAAQFEDVFESFLPLEDAFGRNPSISVIAIAVLPNVIVASPAKADQAIKLLGEIAADSDRADAVHALGAVGSNSMSLRPRIVERVTPLLRERHLAVEALKALAHCGSAAFPVQAQIENCRLNANQEVRKAAEDSLAELKERAAVDGSVNDLSALVKLAASPRPMTRSEAKTVVANANPQLAQFIGLAIDRIALAIRSADDREVVEGNSQTMRGVAEALAQLAATPASLDGERAGEVVLIALRMIESRPNPDSQGRLPEEIVRADRELLKVIASVAGNAQSTRALLREQCTNALAVPEGRAENLTVGQAMVRLPGVTPIWPGDLLAKAAPQSPETADLFAQAGQTLLERLKQSQDLAEPIVRRIDLLAQTRIHLAEANPKTALATREWLYQLLRFSLHDVIRRLDSQQIRKHLEKIEAIPEVVAMRRPRTLDGYWVTVKPVPDPLTGPCRFDADGNLFSVKDVKPVKRTWSLNEKTGEFTIVMPLSSGATRTLVGSMQWEDDEHWTLNLKTVTEDKGRREGARRASSGPRTYELVPPEISKNLPPPEVPVTPAEARKRFAEIRATLDAAAAGALRDGMALFQRIVAIEASLAPEEAMALYQGILVKLPASDPAIAEAIGHYLAQRSRAASKDYPRELRRTIVRTCVEQKQWVLAGEWLDADRGASDHALTQADSAVAGQIDACRNTIKEVMTWPGRRLPLRLSDADRHGPRVLVTELIITDVKPDSGTFHATSYVAGTELFDIQGEIDGNGVNLAGHRVGGHAKSQWSLHLTKTMQSEVKGCVFGGMPEKTVLYTGHVEDSGSRHELGAASPVDAILQVLPPGAMAVAGIPSTNSAFTYFSACLSLGAKGLPFDYLNNNVSGPKIIDVAAMTREADIEVNGLFALPSIHGKTILPRARTGKIAANISTEAGKVLWTGELDAATTPLQISHVIIPKGSLQLHFSFDPRNENAVWAAVYLSKVQGSGAVATPPTPVTPSPTSALPIDLLKPGSVWSGGGMKLFIKSRDGETLQARFTARVFQRDFVARFKDGKLIWLAKDVVAEFGGRGDDNFGTVNGRRIDFFWRGPDGQGEFTLNLEKEGK